MNEWMNKLFDLSIKNSHKTRRNAYSQWVGIFSLKALASLTSSLHSLIETNSFDQLGTNPNPRLRRLNRWLLHFDEWGGAVAKKKERGGLWVAGGTRCQTTIVSRGKRLHLFCRGKGCVNFLASRIWWSTGCIFSTSRTRWSGVGGYFCTFLEQVRNCLSFFMTIRTSNVMRDSWVLSSFNSAAHHHAALFYQTIAFVETVSFLCLCIFTTSIITLRLWLIKPLCSRLSPYT